jgi:hypothetical protein
MAAESTETARAGARLLADVAALGLPELARSRLGRAVVAGVFGPGRGRVCLVVGGVHGDEPASVAASVELVHALAASPPSRPVWVLPVLNPDGIAAGTKDAASGVDLNRNFPAKNFSHAHPPGYDPGPRPLSEPETVALDGLVGRLDLEGIVAVHAPFACVNFDGPAGAWAARVSVACGWPVRGDLGYPTPGSLGSWLGRDRGLPVLTLELPPGPFSSFREPAVGALLAAVAPGPFVEEAGGA